MGLSDLSAEYSVSAKLLSDRLSQLRRMLKDTKDSEEIFHIKRRIADLAPMLTEMYCLAELTERYYEKGYYRDARYSSNCFRDRRDTSRTSKRSAGKYYTERADGSPAGHFSCVPCGEEVYRTDSEGAERKQKHRKSHFSSSREDCCEIYEIPVEVLDKFF